VALQRLAIPGKKTILCKGELVMREMGVWQKGMLLLL
jgi:hypothetical protein